MSTQDFVLPVLGMYPFGEELAGLPDTDTRALLVDIGGGRGQSLIQIRQEWPNLEGKFILQDRPMVLDSFPEIPGVEKMAHDFFTLQPVKRESEKKKKRARRQGSSSQTNDDQFTRCTRVLHPTMLPQLDRRALHQNSPADRAGHGA